jgi:hypothetical protein
MRPLVTPFSASYSAKSNGAPAPAVTLGSKATTVAVESCALEAVLRNDSAVNAAINPHKRPDRRGIISICLL